MYQGIIRKLILNYKFQDKTYLYKTFVKFLLKNKKIVENIKTYDIIIPVPMYKTKKWLRGYNQVELIARELSKDLNIPLKCTTLTKIKDTKKQSSLTRAERKQNIKNAFIVKNASDIENKKILLFDDIITTGSTLNECSKTLKKAKVKEVAILTIAVD